MNQSIPEPYVIKGELPTRYPRGWFCIGADYEFTSVPQKLDYFGTSLVAYRGAESGEVHVLDGRIREVEAPVHVSSGGAAPHKLVAANL